MRIGIIGVGHIGGTAAELFARAGHEVALSNSRRRAIFLAGDDPTAKKVVSDLIEQPGFAPVDTGNRREGCRSQQPGAPICNWNLTQAEALATLATAS